MKLDLNHRLLAGLVVVLAAILAIFYVPEAVKSIKHSHVSNLTSWMQVTSDGEEEEINLPEHLIPYNNKIELVTALPDEFVQQQYIYFWSEYQDVEIFLDEELVYQSNKEERFGKAATSRWNRVFLPEQSQEKELRISFWSPYDDGVNLEEIVYGTAADIEQWRINQYSVGRSLDLLLLVTGCIFVAFGILRKSEVRYKYCQVFFGFTAILVSIWFRTTIKGLPLEWLSPNISALLGTLAFYLIPIPLLIYVQIRAMRVPIMVKICNYMLWGDTLVVIVLFLLQAFGIHDILENRVIGNVCLFISVFWSLFVAMFYYIKERERISVLTVINGFLFAITVITMGMMMGDTGYNYPHISLLTRACVTTIIIFEFFMLHMHLRLKEELQSSMEKQNQNLRLNFLRSQIRPHFILNTVGAIRSLIRVDSECAYELMYDFSNYIRTNLEEKDYSKPVPFLEEMDYIHTYLRLENARFGGRIHLEEEFQTHEFLILPLTIQPFVENAVKHGLRKKQGGTVWIRAWELDDKICIQVEDDGVGFDDASVMEGIDESKSFGMKSAIYRLKYEMGGEITVKSCTESGTNGTLIHIELPAKRGE